MISIHRTQIPEIVLSVLKTLQSKGYPSFLVGGCVRDLLLNKQPKDYDICTKALPEQAKNLFAKVIDTGIKQGKVMGQILRELMEKIIDNPELNTRDQLLIMAEKMALDSEGGD